MFISQSHLPQILGPEFYTDERILDREIDRLFLPGWHCVGALTDIPNNGGYFTTELLGRPLIVWRSGNDVHTFLNVCAHRSSTLSDKPCGHMGERLKCQYHGWEYDETGNTRKIPDAKSFRPMEPGIVGLKKYRTELFGQLIFVTLNEDAPGLRDFLGHIYDRCLPWFSHEHRPTVALDIDNECNWKVVMENVLEGYHLESVHPKTFGTWAGEERCTHKFYSTGDWYGDDYSQCRGWAHRQERIISRIAGVEPQYLWQHPSRYPNTVFGVMALFNWVEVILPLSPTKCRTMWRIFHYPGPRGSKRAALLSAALRAWGRRFWPRVAGEDAAIYPRIQKGINSPQHPKGGLISIREERLFAFQNYVLKAVATDDPLPLEGGVEEIGAAALCRTEPPAPVPAAAFA